MPAVRIAPDAPPELAARLAATYGLSPAADAPAQLTADPDGAVVLVVPGSSDRLRIDLDPRAPRRRLLERAVGRGRGVQRVVDATAGLGRDAWSLIRAGLEVVLCERSAWLAALLDSALERAGRAERVLVGDAARLLAGLDPRPDAVLLDPMFAPRGKSALPKRELALLRALLGEGEDDAALLEAARRVANRRVVVKRHRSAPAIGPDRPIAVLQGHLVRFDVYAPRPA